MSPLFKSFLAAALLFGADAQDDQDFPLCPNDCSNYGGFRDGSAVMSLGHTCNMVWLVSGFFDIFGLCSVLDAVNIPECCADPPPPSCPLCGEGKDLPHPDTEIPGTGLTCRGIQSSLGLSIASGENVTCSTYQFLVSDLCCQEELPENYCQTCPDGDALPYQQLSEELSCNTVIYDQLFTDPSEGCPDVSNLGCCGPKPSLCGANSTCADPSAFLPDVIVEPIRSVSGLDPPTCAEVLSSLSLNQDCSFADELRLDLGCCEGAAECFICLEGGEVEDPSRTLEFLAPGLTCGTANEVGRFIPAEECTIEETGFDIDGYCGCPAGRMPMTACGDLCGTDSVPDPNRIIEGGTTCGELEAVLVWAVPGEICDDFDMWNVTCCEDLSPTASPTANLTMSPIATPTTSPSMSPTPMMSAAPRGSFSIVSLFGMLAALLVAY